MRKNKPDKKVSKKKINIRRSICNDLFALSIIWKAAPSRVVTQIILSVIYGILNFLSGSYLLRVVINGITNQRDTAYIIAYILIVAVSSVGINVLNSLYWNILSKKANKKINLMLYDKSQQVEFACYDNPEFYDKHVKAMDAAGEHICGVLNTFDNIIWRIVTLFSNSLLIFYIDPWLILFAFFPLLLGFVKKSKSV